MIKIPPANTGDIRDVGSIPGLGRSPGEGHGNPVQYSCLENPMDRGAWRAKVHSVAKNQTRLTLLHTHAHGINNLWDGLTATLCNLQAYHSQVRTLSPKR